MTGTIHPALAAIDEEIAELEAHLGRVDRERDLLSDTVARLQSARRKVEASLATAEPPAPKPRAPRGSVEASIREVLALGPHQLDDIATRSGQNRKSVANVLAKLVSAGRVTHSAATGMYQVAAVEEQRSAAE